MNAARTSAVCEECGYSLAGLTWDHECCPECGLPVDLSSLFRRRPAPRAWGLLLRACWPTTALVAGVATILTLAPPGSFIVITAAWPMMLLGWILIAAMIPSEVARTFTDLNIIRPRRTLIRRLLAVAMLAINTAQTAAIAYLFLHLA